MNQRLKGMLELFGTIFLCAAMLRVLRGGLVSNNGFTVVGMDVEGISMGALAFLLAAVYFGPVYGIAIILAVMVHEFGHVAAFRIAGHDDARFRLIPLMGGVAISDRRPDNQLSDFFITLMGPGISLAPLVAAMVLQQAVAPYWPSAADVLWTFAIVTGALNFFNLLPFWPLDGGRCVRIIADTYLPKLTTYVALAMSAGFAAAALSMQSILLFAFALIGAQTLFFEEPEEAKLARLTPRQGLLALGAYLFTAAAHLLGGLAMIAWMI